MKKITLAFFFLTTICGIHGQHNVPLDQWVRDYAEDLGKPDWRNYAAKYGYDSNYEDHQVFRNSYQNYKVEVVRSVDKGEEIMAWVKISAVWEGGMQGDLLEFVKPGSKVEWEEVWSFNVIDGKFGDEWNILQDNSMKMRSVGLKCLPE